MKKSKKQNIINIIKKYKMPLIALLVVIVSLVIGLIISFGFEKEKLAANNNNNEQKVVANTEEGVIKEETFQELQFTNISLISENGYSTFTADVTNMGQEDSNVSDVNIVLQDKDGNEVITLRGNIGTTLKPNETRTITAVTKGELKGVTTKVIAEY